MAWAAVCQLTSTSDKKKNREVCTDLIIRASNQGAEVIFLPECFDYIGLNDGDSINEAEYLTGDTIEYYKKIAIEKSVWLSLGGFHEKIPNKSSIYNSHVLISASGDISGVYRKCHLFSLGVLQETDSTTAGNYILPPINTPVGNVGLQICYDLRFPEASLSLRQLGAEILLYPSAFTVKTGIAHWHVLLRARAIENQCYVIAAAQTGDHNEKRSSYGHACIVNPWGVVISECGDGNTFGMAEIDLNLLKVVREQMPVQEHRRYDLYNNPKK